MDERGNEQGAGPSEAGAVLLAGLEAAVEREAITTARSDLYGGAGWIVFGLLIIAASLRMDRFTSQGATLYTMPGFVPGIFGGVIVVLGAALALRGWRRLRHERADAGNGEPVLNRRVLLTLVVSLAYAIGLIGRVPFTVATVIFLAVFMYLFTPAEASMKRRLTVAALASVITTGVIVLVFEQVFLVRLP